jgi:WD40 repeat protein
VFSPNGKTMATAGDDHTAQLWDTDFASVEARACGKAYPEITRAEWDHYLPDVTYQPPCPR